MSALQYVDMQEVCMTLQWKNMQFAAFASIFLWHKSEYICVYMCVWGGGRGG